MRKKSIIGYIVIASLVVIGFSFATLQSESSTLSSIQNVNDSKKVESKELSQVELDSLNAALDQKNREAARAELNTESADAGTDEISVRYRDTDGWSTGMRSAPIKKYKEGNILTGVASYYHDKFSGRKTANGEIFSQNRYTCACNTLPLGTYVKVTNLKNQKTVVVKVNDRLAKHNRRVVDLSKCSARKIGSISDGLAKVKVEVIDREEAQSIMNTY